MTSKKPLLLAIESSCDDTGVAVISGDEILSNIIACQAVHAAHGGVVPELASRAHLQHIVPTITAALNKAGVKMRNLDGIAVTKGPGLLGSLIVGLNYAKGLSMALDVPLIGVNHMKAHIMAHFIHEKGKTKPNFPFICLTVSGGHTQLVLVRSYADMEVIGTTIDDAAGEAFDKAAKIMGLPYPGGPLIDKYAKEGDPKRFPFPIANMKAYDYSFSGLKTSLLYFLQKEMKKDDGFIKKNLADICASYQYTIVKTLFKKLEKACKAHKVRDVAIAGGVSANSLIRSTLENMGETNDYRTFIPPFEYCTDNAGMIAIAAYYQYLDGNFDTLSMQPQARLKI